MALSKLPLGALPNSSVSVLVVVASSPSAALHFSKFVLETLGRMGARGMALAVLLTLLRALSTVGEASGAENATIFAKLIKFYGRVLCNSSLVTMETFPM